MRRRAKWIWAGVGAVSVSATLSFLSLWPVLPGSAVKTCEDAFGAGIEQDPDGMMAPAKQQAEWYAAQEKQKEATLAKATRLVHQPGMVLLMKADLAMNKGNVLRFASVAYALGYNGIDPKGNAHRLRLMVSFDPDDSFWDRVITFADPMADDDTVDVIPDRALGICERYPQPDVLRGVLSLSAPGSGPAEEFSTSLDDLFINHPNEVLEAINGRPDLEQNVAEMLAGWMDGVDPRLTPIMTQECRSPDARIRSTALKLTSAMKRWET